LGSRSTVAAPRYIYASTASRRRRPYPLMAAGALLAAVIAELVRSAV
jgi:hypothetical protein